jgi:hypothetical protein
MCHENEIQSTTVAPTQHMEGTQRQQHGIPVAFSGPNSKMMLNLAATSMFDISKAHIVVPAVLN